MTLGIAIFSEFSIRLYVQWKVGNYKDPEFTSWVINKKSVSTIQFQGYWGNKVVDYLVFRSWYFKLNYCFFKLNNRTKQVRQLALQL